MLPGDGDTAIRTQSEVWDDLLTGEMTATLERLDFPIVHDPATGRFLPEGDAGGAKAGADAGGTEEATNTALFPTGPIEATKTGRSTVLKGLSTDQQALAGAAMERMNVLFPDADLKVQFLAATVQETMWRGAGAWSMPADMATRDYIGIDPNVTVVLGTQEGPEPWGGVLPLASETGWVTVGLAHVEPAGEYVLDHELGHAVTFAVQAREGGVPSEGWQRWGETFVHDAYDHAGLEYGDRWPPRRGYISGYAQTDPLEFIAEAVAMQHAQLRAPTEQLASRYSEAIVAELGLRLGSSHAAG